jgi:hypothetical protein
MTENSFDRAVQRALRRPAGAGPCPDSAELAAYVDGTLDRAERAGLEAHASACSRCASELALLGRLPSVTGARIEKRGVLSRWPLRWAVPFATAAVVFAVWSEISREDSPATVPSPQSVEEEAAPEARSPAVADSPGLRDQARRDISRPAGPPPLAQPRPDAPRASSSSPRVTPDDTERDTRLERRKSLNEQVQVQAPPPAETEQRQESSAFGSRTPESAPESAAPANDALAKAEPSPEPAAPSALAARKAISAREASAEDGVGPLVVRVSERVLFRVTPAGIERTADGGTTWQVEHTTAIGPAVVAACPTPDACWMGDAAGRLLRRETSGRWVERRLPVEGAITGLEARTLQRATVTLADGRRFTTSDGGESWTILP